MKTTIIRVIIEVIERDDKFNRTPVLEAEYEEKVPHNLNGYRGAIEDVMMAATKAFIT